MKRFPALGAILMAAALGLPFPRPAGAQLIPCKESNAGDKLYLDDVRARIAADAPHLDTLIERLTFKLVANLGRLEGRTNPGMKMLACTARFPGGENDFTPTLCQNLTTEKVVLEVWSSVHREADDEGEPLNVVDISVALVPMVALVTPGAPPGVVRFQQRGRPGEPVKLALRRLDAVDALWGLARVAVGLREFGRKRDDLAFGPLCEGVRVLRSLKDTDQRTRCAAVADHADLMAAAAHARMLSQGTLPDFIAEAAKCEVAP